MSIERNKQVVLDYLAAGAAGDFETMDKLIADEATRWMIPSIPFSGIASKSEIIASFKAVSSASDGPFANKVEYVTAEDDRVAITLTAELKLRSGKVYLNEYNILFIVRDGQIHYMKEYMDTAYFNEIFNQEELSKLG